jgi:DNA-binding transcriptional ArsR family regulator
MTAPPDERASRGADSDVAFDRFVHEPARLNLLTNLFLVESADATWLMQQTGLTWGNLASHSAKLEAAGYISIRKRFKGRKPNTSFSITDAGRAALLANPEQMQ